MYDNWRYEINKIHVTECEIMQCETPWFRGEIAGCDSHEFMYMNLQTVIFMVTRNNENRNRTLWFRLISPWNRVEGVFVMSAGWDAPAFENRFAFFDFPHSDSQTTPPHNQSPFRHVMEYAHERVVRRSQYCYVNHERTAIPRVWRLYMIAP